MTKGIWFFLAIMAFFALTAGFVLAVNPNGANYTGEISTTAAADDPELHNAFAGNMTYMDITGFTTTQSWQGYYGNVTGAIELANTNNKVLYNWSLASPEGEVYATQNGSGQVSWGNIACYNFTGNYSEGGPRLAKLETLFNISTDDVDGVNETFSDANTHAPFFTAGTAFTTGLCPAAYMYGSGGSGSAGTYEEILLTDASDDAQIIFAALLENNENGFDSEKYDFEMLVLENGNVAATTAYYFYVELE
ncbi:hypothetical protein A3K73_05460 [Candidatus Pacearchaeota archaeon RBG_13_36_9]|nr:MAG: hypothetical protein A3K73_05460 [Candidatus Pacearchaeota archaeon RBG_13_36_9]